MDIATAHRDQPISARKIRNLTYTGCMGSARPVVLANVFLEASTADGAAQGTDPGSRACCRLPHQNSVSLIRLVG